MNLISEPWIPVRRADGCRQLIAPWQLTDGFGDNPILAVASPRPDFDGALTQFLIGLLQTTCTPEEEQWWDWREAPPSPEVMKERFETNAHAFVLERDEGPLFMQERLGDKAECHPVTYLLIGAPTDNTLERNTDHFQKRPREDECLCPACAASALYTLQTFAPSGGRGKLTSLRGGGPMTTLILGGNLWETAWLNVVSDGTFTTQLPDPKTFPWLDVAAFITETAPVKTIHSAAMNPEHVLWGMPRRLQLDFASNEVGTGDQRSRCTVCGVAEERMCVGYRDLTGGLTYQEAYKKDDGKKGKRPSWVAPTHPLSPHTLGQDQRPLAVHPQPGGIGYRHWLGIVENSAGADIQRRPARVVEQYRTLVRRDGDLWAFGFDMDNMKARCWYDATMPILVAPEGLEDIFKDLVERLVRAADKVADDLRSSLKFALFGKSKVRGDLSFVQSEFWDATEPTFYDHLRQLRDALPTDSSAHYVLEGWLKTLRAAALSLFDRHSQTGDFDAVNPRQIALARNGLGKALSGAQLMEKILGLPRPQKSTRKKP